MFLARKYFQGKSLKYPKTFSFCLENPSDYTGAKRQSSATKPQELNHLNQQYVASMTLYFENTPCLLCISTLKRLKRLLNLA